MNKQDIYIVDAFSNKLFSGNPAAVCPLKKWISDEQMQNIATENNLSETAFFVANNDCFEIRWFTPNAEVDLCGHATLASAFVIFEQLGYQNNNIVFKSKSGDLLVKRKDKFIQMDFPALPIIKANPTKDFLKSINVQSSEVYESTFDLICILENKQAVLDAKPNLGVIKDLKYRGIILTAPLEGELDLDFYSRCFYPGVNVDEDPVTGSAHCAIAPYWGKRFKKNKMLALQGSSRKGTVMCEINDTRVFLSGLCQLYLKGNIFLS